MTLRDYRLIAAAQTWARAQALAEDRSVDADLRRRRWLARQIDHIVRRAARVDRAAPLLVRRTHE